MTHLAELITAQNLLALTLVAFLVVGATLRLSRLVTTDTLGDWLIVQPALRWSNRAEYARRSAMREVIDEDITRNDEEIQLMAEWEMRLEDGDPITWQARLVSGLGCPFCVGFWLGLLVIAVTVAVSPVVWLFAAWCLLLAALTMNYLVAHLAAKID